MPPCCRISVGVENISGVQEVWRVGVMILLENGISNFMCLRTLKVKDRGGGENTKIKLIATWETGNENVSEATL